MSAMSVQRGSGRQSITREREILMIRTAATDLAKGSGGRVPWWLLVAVIERS
jgi:hypothetical protein